MPSTSSFVIAVIGLFPEGADLMQGCPNVRRAHDVMAARPSFVATKAG